MRKAMDGGRRMGPKGSDIWHKMLDAAEVILRDQGYGNLTSRCVAEHVGVKQRLVYYYFRTMDELIVETFRRLAGRDRERLREGLASRHSLREIWEVCVHTTDTRLVSEFMALANRVEALKDEVCAYIEASRAMQVEALSAAIEARGVDIGLPPVAAAIFASSAALTVHREAEIGLATGHAEVLGVIDAFIARLDPAE